MTRLLVGVVALAAVAVACGPRVGTVASGTAAPGATTPSAAIATNRPSPSAAVPSDSPNGLDPAFEAYGAAFCSAFDELLTAYGNPDTGSHSDLFNALEAAIETGDAASIDQAAAEVRSHLEAGRAHTAAAAAAWPPAGPVMVQLDRFFMAFEAMTDAMRASSDANAGQAAFEKAGGVEAWTAMFQAFGEMDRPAGVGPRQCPTAPIGY